MTPSKASFLVPGIGYLALGCATLGYGLLQARLPSATSLPVLALIVVLVAAFYFAMGASILRRKGKRFVLIGSCFSCIVIPFGTALGLTFLLWTRRKWTEDTVTVAQAEPSASPNGGPASLVGNSGVSKGPPSVS